MEKKLQRDEHNKMVAGVCAGLAEYFNIDITIIRAVFLLSLVLHGSGAGVYIVLWIVMPKKNYRFNNRNFNNGDPIVDYTVPPQYNAGPVDYTVPNAFGSTQQTGAPFAMPPKKKSNAAVIVGIALVVFGSFFLLDNLGLIPDWDFDHVWPFILVVAGLVLVFSKKNNEEKPWEKETVEFNTEAPAADPTEPTTETTENKDDKKEDTPPAV